MNRFSMLRFATAAVAVAGLSFAAGSAMADHHMESQDSNQQRSGGMQSQQAQTAQDAESGKTIVDVATEAGQFNTLVKAVQAADLVETLQGEGPFTVFAPTDDAFEALPSGSLDRLLKPESQEMLKTVLLYHVVSGENKAADITQNEESEIETVAGQSIKVTVDGENVLLNGTVKVIKTDIAADNGIIHVIDGVLLPRLNEAGSDAAGSETRDTRDDRDSMDDSSNSGMGGDGMGGN